MAQNGQCSRWIGSRVAGSAIAPWSMLTLTNFVPPMLQISAQVSPGDTDKAWEIDGAIAANSIAQHAIQAAKRRVTLLIPIPGLYQRARHFVNGKSYVPLPPAMTSEPGARRRLSMDIALSKGLTINAPISPSALDWLGQDIEQLLRRFTGGSYDPGLRSALHRQLRQSSCARRISAPAAGMTAPR